MTLIQSPTAPCSVPHRAPQQPLGDLTTSLAAAESVSDVDRAIRRARGHVPTGQMWRAVARTAPALSANHIGAILRRPVAYTAVADNRRLDAATRDRISARVLDVVRQTRFDVPWATPRLRAIGVGGPVTARALEALAMASTARVGRADVVLLATHFLFVNAGSEAHPPRFAWPCDASISVGLILAQVPLLTVWLEGLQDVLWAAASDVDTSTADLCALMEGIVGLFKGSCVALPVNAATLTALLRRKSTSLTDAVTAAMVAGAFPWITFARAGTSFAEAGFPEWARWLWQKAATTDLAAATEALVEVPLAALRALAPSDLTPLLASSDEAIRLVGLAMLSAVDADGVEPSRRPSYTAELDLPF